MRSHLWALRYNMNYHSKGWSRNTNKTYGTSNAIGGGACRANRPPYPAPLRVLVRNMNLTRRNCYDTWYFAESSSIIFGDPPVPSSRFPHRTHVSDILRTQWWRCFQSKPRRIFAFESTESTVRRCYNGQILTYGSVVPFLLANSELLVPICTHYYTVPLQSRLPGTGVWLRRHIFPLLRSVRYAERISSRDPDPPLEHLMWSPLLAQNHLVWTSENRTRKIWRHAMGAFAFLHFLALLFWFADVCLSDAPICQCCASKKINYRPTWVGKPWFQSWKTGNHIHPIPNEMPLAKTKNNKRNQHRHEIWARSSWNFGEDHEILKVENEHRFFPIKLTCYVRKGT
jgi:hypothetical protein